MRTLLRDIPIVLRPRERIKISGPSALSDAELLAIVLGSGIRGRDVMRIAVDALAVIDRKWPNVTTADLTSLHGMGPAKAHLIVASLEFARRRIAPAGVRIRNAEDAFAHVRHFADRKQEHFLCLSLNGAHEVIATRVVTVGLVNSAPVHPREVFCDPICDRACAVLVAHNHPSGNTEPSEQDIATTRSLRDAGRMLGISLLDHLVFTSNGFYSFTDTGKMALL